MTDITKHFNIARISRSFCKASESFIVFSVMHAKCHIVEFKPTSILFISTGQSLSLAEKYSLIRRDLANLSRSVDSCSSLILLGVGQKLSPLESIRISAGFRSFDDKLTTVSFWSLLISLCLENLRFPRSDR